MWFICTVCLQVLGNYGASQQKEISYIGPGYIGNTPKEDHFNVDFGFLMAYATVLKKKRRKKNTVSLVLWMR